MIWLISSACALPVLFISALLYRLRREDAVTEELAHPVLAPEAEASPHALTIIKIKNYNLTIGE